MPSNSRKIFCKLDFFTEIELSSVEDESWVTSIWSHHLIGKHSSRNHQSLSRELKASVCSLAPKSLVFVTETALAQLPIDDCF